MHVNMDTTNPLMPEIPSDQDMANMSDLQSFITKCARAVKIMHADWEKEEAIKKKLLRKKKDIEALIQASNALQKGLEAQMSRTCRAMGNAKRQLVERPGAGLELELGAAGADAAGAGSSKIN